MYPRLKFINRFYLYIGLCKYYQLRQHENLEFAKAAQVISQTMDKYEKSLMSIYNCNSDWPICLFDFSYKNKNPNYIAYKVKDPLTLYIKQDYFYGERSEL